MNNWVTINDTVDILGGFNPTVNIGSGIFYILGGKNDWGGKNDKYLKKKNHNHKEKYVFFVFFYNIC